MIFPYQTDIQLFQLALTACDNTGNPYTKLYYFFKSTAHCKRYIFQRNLPASLNFSCAEWSASTVSRYAETFYRVLNQNSSNALFLKETCWPLTPLFPNFCTHTHAWQLTLLLEPLTAARDQKWKLQGICATFSTKSMFTTVIWNSPISNISK